MINGFFSAEEDKSNVSLGKFYMTYPLNATKISICLSSKIDQLLLLYENKSTFLHLK